MTEEEIINVLRRIADALEDRNKMVKEYHEEGEIRDKKNFEQQKKLVQEMEESNRMEEERLAVVHRLTTGQEAAWATLGVPPPDGEALEAKFEDIPDDKDEPEEDLK